MRKLGARVKDVNSTRKKYVLLYYVYIIIYVSKWETTSEIEREQAHELKKNHIINNKQQT